MTKMTNQAPPELPQTVFHGTSAKFIDDMAANGINECSYWTNSFEVAQGYANSYPDGVVLEVNLKDYAFEANLQVAQCLLDDGEIDALPESNDLAHSLEHLEGVVCKDKIDFSAVSVIIPTTSTSPKIRR